ncbi:MAG: hypothetical protein JNJ61_18040 [Anaerolineae bacterium]|nr:hypothetical protein [Anaerolineae bacterium]
MKAARPRLDIPLTSLLWPGTRPTVPPRSVTWEGDLGVNDLISALAPAPRYAPFVRQTLTALLSDPAVIGWRQAVLADFDRSPHLRDQCEALLPRLAGLGHTNPLLGKRQRNLLLDTADQLAELDAYVSVAVDLSAALNGADAQSPALCRLRDDLGALVADPGFQELRAELPALREPLERITSLTIGINLDLELRPLSAVLLAINDHKLMGSASWLERVLGKRGDEGDESGLAALHHLPDDPNHRVLAPLFQDLDRLLTQVAQPIAKALGRYARGGAGALTHLEYELAFFTAAARLMLMLRGRGVPLCWPQIAPADERCIIMDDLVNAGLACRSGEQPVASPVQFDGEGRIAVLTGPNSGGKTTYLRAVGLALVLAQVGLFVPARSARITPVDAILTHFPALETRQQGRLAEEAGRLRDLFRQATPHSLVLLNETFSSTASGEAFYLAQDILCALRARGLRAIFATHLTDLAEKLPEIEALVAGESRLFSLVAGVSLDAAGEATPTYAITRGTPLGRSYAREIARRHGISLEQLLGGG